MNKYSFKNLLQLFIIIAAVICVLGWLISALSQMRAKARERLSPVKSETKLLENDFARTFEHDGHTFIFFHGGSGGIQVLHHPSCANICAKEKF